MPAASLLHQVIHAFVAPDQRILVELEDAVGHAFVLRGVRVIGAGFARRVAEERSGLCTVLARNAVKASGI